MQNKKDEKLQFIVDMVVQCCGYHDKSITKDKVLSHCKEENVVLTRCILATAIKKCGYTVTTIKSILEVTHTAVRKMLSRDYDLYKTNYAYMIAREDVFDKLNHIIQETKK